ncbi:MAG: hypothetical protein MI919_42235, partial [Holophagales bacterium]|nr:hypothetical protein [Holophagales bacterium]
LTTSFALPSGERRESQARLVGRYALGGLGIAVDETHGGPDAGVPFTSTVIYSVDPETRAIVGASNNSLANRKHYAVLVEKERIVIRQSGELFDGRRGFNRHVITRLGPDRFQLQLDACTFEPGESETKDGEDAFVCRENTYSYVAKRNDSPR